ncbi:uncharacterized protein PHACADRAFT_205357 [Phanerochaete carnosa HHB-10118-sp]|uniref:Gamma tubulin complex component protein N-terminal domain-containing protein n=1 Tax=Phanerochaete carnosa (strain HHB-10118-sp) TaxID=650164 RepID=K5WIH3_PHACS|nr:uncharacterized protein PHACADRAFT_205357 [Phanerochaete carnosa HHB-10118-sp]EKM59180.1 hypothetical protein PHACADRAFT_205357 [Phanerochaete carnosa HHB-10118-sp]
MASNLESLVCSLVPGARHDHRLRDELVAHCNEIVNSHIGQSNEPDIGHLADSIKRHLLRTSPNGVPALRFSNLLARLLEQPVLSRKHASLSFLHALGTTPAPSTRSPAALPVLTLPPQPRAPSRLRETAPTPAQSLPAAGRPKGKSRADTLREYRAKIDRQHLPESALLRDTLYLLQGISGKHVQFASINDPESNQLIFKDDSRHIIPPPTKALIHRLAEVGYLYIRVDSFVREREGKAGIGMIEQSLCHHLQSQLTEYYRLIAVLESQMSANQSSEDIAEGEAAPSVREEETGLTLKRLDVWIQEWRLRMRMMSVCVEGAQSSPASHDPPRAIMLISLYSADTHGGALVNLIHGYTDNGDPFVRKFTDQLLEEVSKPFFATLHKWLFSGELNDPFSEFFVSVDPGLLVGNRPPVGEQSGPSLP